jgi:hypothetical protein
MTHHVFHVADRKLAKQLTESGIPPVDLHGNLSQAARNPHLAAFAANEARVLVGPSRWGGVSKECRRMRRWSTRAPERANDFLSVINPVRLRAGVFGTSVLNERSK